MEKKTLFKATLREVRYLVDRDYLNESKENKKVKGGEGIDFSKYDHKLVYPKAPKKPHLHSTATPKEIREHEDAIEKFNILMIKHRDEQKKYREEEVKLFQSFKKDVMKEVGLSRNPKADKIFAYAWAAGHSNGYSEVYAILCDLSDLFL